jgi:hypothetical protein
MSFSQILAQKKASVLKPSHHWMPVLEKLTGRIGSDRIERIATEKAFDALGLLRHERTPEAAKQLRTLMVELGWTAVRTMDVTSRGRASRVRGYARVGC